MGEARKTSYKQSDINDHENEKRERKAKLAAKEEDLKTVRKEIKNKKISVKKRMIKLKELNNPESLAKLEELKKEYAEYRGDWNAYVLKNDIENLKRQLNES